MSLNFGTLKARRVELTWFVIAIALFVWGDSVRQFFWAALLAGIYYRYKRMQLEDDFLYTDDQARRTFLGFAAILAVLHGIASVQSVHRDRQFWRDVDDACEDYSSYVCERISEARNSAAEYHIIPSSDE